MRVLLAVLVLGTGCYRMPTDDDFCVIPTTNNPSVTREAGHQSAVPGMKM